MILNHPLLHRQLLSARHCLILIGRHLIAPTPLAVAGRAERKKTMALQNPSLGTAHNSTGGLSEKRVISYSARHFGIPVDNVCMQALTPDASTRKYYRVAPTATRDKTCIISLYPSPFNAHDNSFLDVTRLFESVGLPVPKIIDIADTEGIILQEDLGDQSLTKWLNEADRNGDNEGSQRMMQEAISLIARIQSASQQAYEINSVASRLAFDEDKLSWELNYFYDHFFGSYLGRKLESRKAELIRKELHAIASELSARPRELTHRDYHGMNLMVDSQGRLRIIDHQDARMGPATYDLVPLLVERRLQPADEAWVEAQQDFYLKTREELKMSVIDRKELQYEFHLMTVQRQLKAIGTFSYQTAVVGRGIVYEKYILPAIATVLRALGKPGMKEYPGLRDALESA